MTVTRKRESRGIVTSEEKIFKRTFVKVLFLMRGGIQLCLRMMEPFMSGA